MNSLKILRAGPYVSVQDVGRPGFLRSGISCGGVVDQRALEEGRLLVGNEKGLASLEMLGIGGRFQCGERALRLALTGAVFSANVDGKGIKSYSGFLLQPGQVLEIGAAKNGNYGYLSIHGGVDVEPVLGSRSTHLKARFGGFKGRCLKSGDVLMIGACQHPRGDLTLPQPDRQQGEEIRILWAAQADLFGKDELQRFVESRFEISHEIDRMGARLISHGEPIHAQQGLVVISGAIAAGDIQIPGSGQPIVLLADRQPTGGYPRIATIIGADLEVFAQFRAGSFVRFNPVSEQCAVEALFERQREMEKLPDQLGHLLIDPLESHKLLSENLISGVVSSDDKSKDYQ